MPQRMVRSLVELTSIEWSFGPYDEPTVTVRSPYRTVNVTGPSVQGGGCDEMFGLAIKVLMMDDEHALALLGIGGRFEASNFYWWVQMSATSDLGLTEVSLTRGEKLAHPRSR